MEFASTILSSVPTAVMVLAYLAYQDYRDGKFRKEPPTTKILKEAEYMHAHYNDELSDTLVRMEGKQDKTLEETTKNSAKLDEVLKYGVPMRRNN